MPLKVNSIRKLSSKIFDWFKKNNTKAIIFVGFFLLLVFTRFYNLDHTARFIWDESSDLVKIHQYYVDKDISLVGPISEDGQKVFGSLTYYMLMPFAAIGKFDPVSTAYGASFWGTIAALIFLLMVIKTNRSNLLLACFLVLVWIPLIETSRWAWNPNLIPFWVFLGLLLFNKKSKLLLFLSGLSLGLTFHHHYLSAFSIIGFLLGASVVLLQQKLFRNLLAFVFGVICSILPFVIFDLRHPPGLFLSRILYFNQMESNPSVLSLIINIFGNFKQFGFYSTHLYLVGYLLLFIAFVLLILDFKKRREYLPFALGWLLQIVLLGFVKNIYDHYLIPAISFFIVWLFLKRDGLGKLLANISIILLILSSSLFLKYQLTHRDWQTDIASTRKIVNTIYDEVTTKNLQNSNIAVLASPDPNTYGRKYRDLLLVKGILLDTKYEYFSSKYLFVVSTSDENTVRNDAAAEMSKFRNSEITNKWSIADSPWVMYLFEK